MSTPGQEPVEDQVTTLDTDIPYHIQAAVQVHDHFTLLIHTAAFCFSILIIKPQLIINSCGYWLGEFPTQGFKNKLMIIYIVGLHLYVTRPNDS